MRVDLQSNVSTRGKPTIGRPLQPASSTRRELNRRNPQTAVLTPTLASHKKSLSGPNSEGPCSLTREIFKPIWLRVACLMPGTGPLTAAVDTLPSGMVSIPARCSTEREEGGSMGGGGGPNERGGGGCLSSTSAGLLYNRKMLWFYSFMDIPTEIWINAPGDKYLPALSGASA
ncbi:MAG: hypothetical protein L6R36_006097 [Xanthoria steineri]|nr:MAG: hypothetical protein L6R36_006097 [Xanthoria steineri]